MLRYAAGRQVQTCRPVIGTDYSERDLLARALLVDDPRAAGQGQQSHAGVQGNTHITGVGTLCGGISGLGRGRGVAGSGLNIATGVAGPVSAVIVECLIHGLAAGGADLPVIEPVVLPLTGGVVGICRCNGISAFTDDRSCAVSVICAGVRRFGFGDGTAVVLTSVPVSGSVIMPFTAEIV